MKFGPVPLEEARGAIMAHSQRVGERMIRKGSVLDEAALTALREAGRKEVIVARLEPGDVPEDIAADRLAQPLVSPLIGAHPRGHRPGEPCCRGAGPAACRYGDDQPPEHDRRITDHRHLAGLRDRRAEGPGGHGQDHPVLGAGQRAGRRRSADPPGRLAVDRSPVPSPQGRSRRHRTARPEGQRHREDHRGDRTADHPAYRVSAAATACAA